MCFCLLYSPKIDAIKNTQLYWQIVIFFFTMSAIMKMKFHIKNHPSSFYFNSMT